MEKPWVGEGQEGGGCAPSPLPFCGHVVESLGVGWAKTSRPPSASLHTSPKMGAGVWRRWWLWGGDEAVVVAPCPQRGCSGWPHFPAEPHKLGMFSAGPRGAEDPRVWGKFRNWVLRLQEMGPCGSTAVVPAEVGPGPCLSCPRQVRVVWGPNPDLAHPVWRRPHRSLGLIPTRSLSAHVLSGLIPAPDARWGRAAGGRAPGTPQGLHLGPICPSMVLQAQLRQGLAPWISQSLEGNDRRTYRPGDGGNTGTIGAATLLAVQGTTAGRCSAWVSPGMWS